MIQRGEANTRWRDFADVFVLQRLHGFKADVLRRSITAVSDYRNVALTTLLPALADMPERTQEKWAGWRARNERQTDLPESFAKVLQSVAAFTDPVLSKTINSQTWNSNKQVWR